MRGPQVGYNDVDLFKILGEMPNIILKLIYKDNILF
jgi:hypothetical protein